MSAKIITMIEQTSHWSDFIRTIISQGYYRGLNLYLWIGLTLLMTGAALVFIGRSKKEDLLNTQRWIYRGFFIFFLGFAATRALFIASYFIEPYYNLLLAIGYATASLGILPMVIIYEKYIIKNTKWFFSVVGGVLTVISIYFIFVPAESSTSRTIQTIGMPIIAASFFFLYLWMIVKSTGEIRKKALITLLGFLLWGAGTVLDGETFLEGMTNPVLISDLGAILMIIGTIIITMMNKPAQ